MRKFVLRLAAITGMLALGACADSPTAGNQPHDLSTAEAPLLDQTVSGCVGDRDGVCMLDPVIVDPYCDPWSNLDWCEGDDCTYSDTSATGPEYQGTLGCGEPIDPYKPAPRICPDYGCPPPDDGTCDPQYQLKCHKPLTAADKATIQLALQRHLKPASQFTDPAKAQQCAALSAEFNRMYSAGQVYRGSSDTPEGHPLTQTHVALYYTNTGAMHFEPAALNAANSGDPAAIRNILNSALHESAHALGYLHTDALWSGNYDLYAEAPFDLLSPGTNSCITNW